VVIAGDLNDTPNSDPESPIMAKFQTKLKKGYNLGGFIDNGHIFTVQVRTHLRGVYYFMDLYSVT